MGVQKLPNYIEKYSVTLESGTSWTVPAGCHYVNVTLVGGGGGSGAVGGGGTTGGTAGGTTTFTGATSAPGGALGAGKSVTTTISSGGSSVGSAGVNGLGTGGKLSSRLQWTFTSGTGITAVNYNESRGGEDGEIIKSTVDTTPGAAITYAIGAGGTAGAGTHANGAAGGSGRIDIEYFI